MSFVSLDVVHLVWWRIFFASVFLGIYGYFTKEIRLPSTKRQLFLYLLMSAMWLINLLAFYQAIAVSSVAVGVLSFSTFPLWTTFLEPIFTKKRLQGKDVLLAVFTVFGLALVCPSYDLGTNIAQGLLWGCLSGLMISLLSLTTKFSSGTSTQHAFYQNLGATLLLLPFVVITGFTMTYQDFWILLALGTVFSAIPQLLLFKSLQHLRAQTSSVVLSLESIYGIALAWLLLSEVPTVRMLIGGSIILFATCYVGIQKEKVHNA